ncbi:hypothetical protein [Streptomyces sp. NPDC088400]|uniref:hypothetical protein n=1 Tax=Streptomyces sp. NPDC088400 TaxID=3365861 RepID=UPI003817833F
MSGCGKRSRARWVLASAVVIAVVIGVVIGVVVAVVVSVVIAVVIGVVRTRWYGQEPLSL